MSLYERIDHSPRPSRTFEFLFVYVVCFVVMLFPASIRRLNRWIDHDRTAIDGSIFKEARTMAMNCAESSFMGM